MVQMKKKQKQPIGTDPAFKHAHVLVTPGKSLRSCFEERIDLRRQLTAGTFLGSVISYHQWRITVNESLCEYEE